MKHFDFAIDETRKRYLRPERLATLTDGVFAIVMTLLVLQLHVPANEAPEHLFTALALLWPMYVSYIASFVMLGIYWVAHHIVFNVVRFVDRTFIWLNLFFLLMVSLIPFFTALLGQYGTHHGIPLLYGLSLMLIGLLVLLQWAYATHGHRLVDPSLPAPFIRMVRRRLLLTPVLCIVAIALSFVNTHISILLFMFLPIYYILPGRIDEYWRSPVDD